MSENSYMPKNHGNYQKLYLEAARPRYDGDHRFYGGLNPTLAVAGQLVYGLLSGLL